jgi:hypothetical protein
MKSALIAGFLVIAKFVFPSSASPALDNVGLANQTRHTNGLSENPYFVKPYHYIYFNDYDHTWDSAPVVVESHKLLFFTTPKVGCTVWKQLFRRMMGYDDWKSQDYRLNLPHDPANNGLKYLYNYSLEEANYMMTSAEWTRALMVRDPKMRFLSAFQKKSVKNDHKFIIQKCCPDGSCVSGAQSVSGFLRLVGICADDHWRLQVDRVDGQFWPYIDEILHLENAAADAEKLLRRIGAWEEFGATGWGKDGQFPIFGTKHQSVAGEHATHAERQVWNWYTPETEEEVEAFYGEDYNHHLFNFTRGGCLTCQQ